MGLGEDAGSFPRYGLLEGRGEKEGEGEDFDALRVRELTLRLAVVAGREMLGGGGILLSYGEGLSFYNNPVNPTCIQQQI